MNKFKCHGAVQSTLAAIGGKWKILILWHLLEKKMRFNELQKSLKTISQKMLANELRSLEANGLVHREVFRQVPPKVEYWATTYGETLKPLLTAMADWGYAHKTKKPKMRKALK
ncbi:transcriptional regulator [Candidatus Falkowbacteria bacterium HGW-Falkowbacteria-2]|uniref:Transcriptional regulator n=1 Tax=Candidatus Falkowbacteria bacterium HGW-Falkowbacteria-2 TaxID=2013769 RepID=A0A2N2E3X8_9BACT|nr:MAG: transcriptional regulator [Candidatus Falkowbacteria bacterium HGW-Falkowbacteria-2]